MTREHHGARLLKGAAAATAAPATRVERTWPCGRHSSVARRDGVQERHGWWHHSHRSARSSGSGHVGRGPARRGRGRRIGRQRRGAGTPVCVYEPFERAGVRPPRLRPDQPSIHIKIYSCIDSVLSMDRPRRSRSMKLGNST
eukprot:scaffold1942_cov351-Prasinococcus_capsulatus_cf.AAC.8